MNSSVLNLSAGCVVTATPRWWGLSRVGEAIRVFITGEIIQRADALIAEIGDAADVHLHVDSTGGDAVTALGVYDALKGRCSVATINQAASAAVAIALAADRRLIVAGGRFMVHSARTVAFATASGLREAATITEEADERLLQILLERTGRPADVVKSWMAGPDRWFTAEEAIAAGLAHEIIPATAVATSIGDVTADIEPDDSEFCFSLLRAAGRIKVRDRRQFIRNLCVWASNDSTVTETKK